MLPNPEKLNHLPPIRYRYKKDPFYDALRQRINTYFEDRNLSRYADHRMVGKTIFQVSMWGGLYALIMSDWFAGIVLILLQVSWHFTMFLMSVGIAHDGSHNSYSKKKWVNRVMAKCFDFIGINSDMWEYNHILSHHNAPNIPVYDSAIYSFWFFRLHPEARHYKIHKYQHLYIFVIYALATLFKLFFLDFFSFRRKRIGFVMTKRMPLKKVLWLFGTKALVITYTLVLPLIFLSAPTWQILLGFVLGHVVSGISLGVIFQVTHIGDFTKWPVPDENGVIDNSFTQHIMETTGDFAPESWLATWVSGGLNIHVAHHLFPRVSQIHLRPLAKIVKEAAKEFDVPYKVYPTVWSAVVSHLRTVKRLGNPDTPPPVISHTDSKVA